MHRCIYEGRVQRVRYTAESQVHCVGCNGSAGVQWMGWSGSDGLESVR